MQPRSEMVHWFFATGFLFFLVTLCLSLPGVLLLGLQSLRGLTTRTAAPDG